MAWIGLAEVEHALAKVAADATKASKLIVRDSVVLVERAAKKNFEGHHKRGYPHVGGDKPNVVTGALRRSIHADPIRAYGTYEYGTSIGPRTVYARRVELGFDGGAGRGQQATRAFPYFRPAVESTREAMHEIAARHWREIVLKGRRG